MIRTLLARRRDGSPVTASALNYDGQGKLSSFKTVDPFYTFSVLRNTDGKFYFAAMGRYETNRDPYIFKYNRATNKIEDEFRINIGIRTADSHRSPCISHDNNGQILVAIEQLQETADSHGTPINIYKTSTASDLATLKRINTLSGRFAYPQIYANGQTVFVSARGSTNLVTFIRGDYYYWLSTDGGATFGSAVHLYDSGNEQKVAYFQRVHAYNGEYHLILNERDNDLSNWTFVAHIKSSDGATWTNQAGTFSKNVTTSGAITRAEMIANCLVLQSPNTSTIAVCFEGGVVKTSSGIRLCLSVQSLTGNTFEGNPEVNIDELRFYTYSAGWSYNNVTLPANLVTYWAYERPVQYLNNDEAFDDIILVDLTTSHNVYKKRSTDNFGATTDTLLLAGNDKYMMGEGAYNVSNEEDYIVILNNPQGDIFEISSSEGIEDYSDLTIIRP